jgi:hypothetical protein
MYPCPSDGHLAKLVVQATDQVYAGSRNSTWRRTFIRNVSPISMRVANWPFTSVPVDSSQWTSDNWRLVCLKWLPTCGALIILVRRPFICFSSPFEMSYVRPCCNYRHNYKIFIYLFSLSNEDVLRQLFVNPTGAAVDMRHNGWYDAFLYRFWGYPKVARNPREDRNPIRPLLDRMLGPRFLCFIEGDKHFVVHIDASNNDTPYVFVSYTAQQFDDNNTKDLDALSLMAERAARDAGVRAFWLASSCMSAAHLEEDVYRISDSMYMHMRLMPSAFLCC